MRSVALSVVPLAAVVLSLCFSVAGTPAAAPPPVRPAGADHPARSRPGAVPVDRESPASVEASAPAPEPPDIVPGEALIEVGRAGALCFRGERLSPAGLVHALAAFADRDRDASTWQDLSRGAVRVVADPDTPWRLVRRVLASCTRPEVRIARLRLTAGGTERVAVRTDRIHKPGVRVRWEILPVIVVALFREAPSVAWTRVKLLDCELGHDAPAFKLLVRRVGQISRLSPEIDGEIEADGNLPTRDVVRTLALYRRAGVPRTHLADIPAPSWAVEGLIHAMEDRNADRIDERLRAAILEGGYMGRLRLDCYLKGEGRKHAEWIAGRMMALLVAEQGKDGFDKHEWWAIAEALGEAGARALGEAARRGSEGALTALERWYPPSLTIHALPGVRIAATHREIGVRSKAVRVLALAHEDDRRSRETLARIADDAGESPVLRDLARDALEGKLSSDRTVWSGSVRSDGS